LAISCRAWPDALVSLGFACSFKLLRFKLMPVRLR
jgi:hypothetical protein